MSAMLLLAPSVLVVEVEAAKSGLTSARCALAPSFSFAFLAASFLAFFAAAILTCLFSLSGCLQSVSQWICLQAGHGPGGGPRLEVPEPDLVLEAKRAEVDPPVSRSLVLMTASLMAEKRSARAGKVIVPWVTVDLVARDLGRVGEGGGEGVHGEDEDEVLEREALGLGELED